MFRIKVLFSATVLLLFMGAVIWVFSRSTPVPQIILANGTVLRVEALTFGTNHVFTTESEWKRKLRARLPQMLRGMLGPEGYRNEFNQSDEELVIWISQYNPVKDAYLMPTFDACEIIAENGQRFHVWSSSSGDDHGFKEKHFYTRQFPRRQKSFRLRFTDNGQPVELEVANPHVWTGTEWTARALPQTQTVSQVDFVLEKVEIQLSSDGDSWTTKTFAVYAGDEDRTEWYQAQTTYLDVTGNSDHNTLSIQEPVWKLRTKFHRTAKAQFETNEIIPLMESALPASGEYQIIPITEELKATGVKFIALTGPGRFRFENEKCISTQPWEDHMGQSSSSSIGDSHWWYQFSDKKGRLVFISEHNDPAKFDYHQQEQNYLIRAHRRNGEIKQATSNGWSSSRRNNQMTMTRQYHLEDIPTDEVLRFELIDDGAVKAEYFIAAPQPAGKQN